MRLGSLCSGVGMLDVAVAEVFGAEHAWFFETDKDCRTVLGKHWPDVPRYEDLTTTDFNEVPKVDIVCAGWPCQPSSQAGRRKGKDDDRWIWPEIAGALRVLRPRLFIGENVLGLFTIDAGDRFAEVLGDLAEMGFDAEWGVFSAAEVGACHRRERVFVLAHSGCPSGWAATGTPVGDQAGIWEDERVGSAGAARSVAVGDGNRRQGFPEQDGQESEAPDNVQGWDDPDRLGVGTLTLLPAEWARDYKGDDPALGLKGGPNLSVALALMPAEWASDGPGAGEHGEGGPDLLTSLVAENRWADYAPAIERWERVMGESAPEPLEIGPQGGKRLAPDFPRWMMGMPKGWMEGIPRKSQLRCAGNAVVPHQAAMALRVLSGWASTT